MNPTTDTQIQVRSVSWESGQRTESTYQISMAEFADMALRAEDAVRDWLEEHLGVVPQPAPVMTFISPTHDQIGPLAKQDQPTPDPSTSPVLIPSAYAKWYVRTPGTLIERVKKLGAGEFLIGDVLPVRSIAIIVGDSGLGKSPLAYQMAVSVASGTPFLGHTVKQASVLYMDFENGLSQVSGIVERISTLAGIDHCHLSGLGLWNVNDAPSSWGERDHTIYELINDVRPQLIFIDSLGSWHPEVERDNSIANKALGRLREVAGRVGATVVSIHHLRKPSSDPPSAPKSLEEEEPRRWFLQARGPRAIINSTDVRIGVDKPGQNTSKMKDAQAEIALVMRGFGRVKGEIPLTYLGRVFDASGDPMGYKRLTGSVLLFNDEHKKAFDKLPETFRFKDAQMALGKGAQATADFLNKAMGAGLLRNPSKGKYEKVKETG